jgi:dipeptidyl aminopeptidase/acylaminoacyl peptidase
MISEITMEDIYSLPRLQHFTIAPDSSELCFVSFQYGISSIYWMPSSPAFPRLCHQCPNPISALKWSPKGDWLAWSGNGINMWSPKKGAKMTVTNQANYHLLAWAPHGRSLLMVERNEDNEAIWVSTLDGSMLNRVRQFKSKIHSASWSPDGQHVLIISEPYQESKIICEIIQIESEETVMSWEEPYPIYLIPTGTWFPESKRLLVSSLANGYSKLWILNLETKEKVCLSQGDSEEFSPILSKDGSQVAYSSHRIGTGDWSLVIHKVGANQSQPLIQTPGINTPIAWYSNGFGLFFVHEDSQEPGDLWKIDFESGGPCRLTYSNYMGLEKKVAPPQCGFLNPQARKSYCQLYYPPDFQENSQYPLVIWLKEYPHTPNWNGFFPRYNWLANQGYLVAVVTYQGSTDAGLEFMKKGLNENMVLAPLEDIQEVLSIFRKTSYLSPGKVGIGGMGWGGYLSLMVVSHNPDLFKCAFTYGAITDWEIQQCSTEWQKYFYQITGKWYVEDPGFFKENSPYYLMSNIKVPLLLTHGKEDRIVPFLQAHKFVEEAGRMKLKIQSHFYEKEGHILQEPHSFEDWYERILRFLNQNLLPWKSWRA